ncbi:MAG: gfo/Idh/MocA family oxidoreductase [Luteitalea sp.]|nr:gfo/Idh/MocA family oxidoreductase [Luteitalea sp.]
MLAARSRPRSDHGLEPVRSRKDSLDRRQFLDRIGVASALTILPRHVLGGPGHVAPSDRINLAQIGCGTQSTRQVNGRLLTREDLQFTCVCDPNTDSTNYVDWSRDENRKIIRRLLGDPSWGARDPGIRGGREVSRQIIETYYGRGNRSGSYGGVRAYADFRELLDREADIDGLVIITPDHTHAAIAIAAMQKGKAAVMHKPVSNVLHEVRRTIAVSRQDGVVSHLLAYGDHADHHKLDAWLKAGVIGPIREVHNWTSRPFWPQGWLDYPTETPAVPEGFDWDLWLGPEPHRAYHPSYTFALYRGWYNYGGGCLADMGNYSLWPVYRLLDLGVPTSVEARCNTVAFVNEENVSNHRLSQVAYPIAGTLHFRHSARGDRPPVEVYWYEGGIRPRTPEELYDAREDLDAEGMMFVGDSGKILCDFRGTEPRLLPESRMREVEGVTTPDDLEVVDSDDEWINAIKQGGRSRGSFDAVAALAESTALAGVAFRMGGQRLDWDAQTATFSNVPEANAYLKREYRPGWEL